MPKQTPVKVMEGSDQLQFEVEHETLQPEKFTEPSSETVQEVVQERQDEPTQGLESYSLARDRKQGTPRKEALRYKTRLVAKGILQNEGVDYNEIFSPVVKHSSIRLLLAFIAHEDLELDQLDVKTTFLHRELDELIYMQPPKGFREGIKDGQSNHDGCVYFKLTKGSMVYLLLYVDGMLVACKEKRHLDQVKEMLKVEFEMKDLGSTKRILGMEIERDRSKKVLRLSQKSYISKVLSRFEMNNVKTVSTPLGQHFRLSITQAPETHEEKRFMQMIPYASMVGSLMYTMVCSRPDLAYAVSMISRYMSCPRKPH
ncbi:Retrovirus-related Pol polyprotein from transposon TNT 1-94 [Vitis vinifera]|uniref:Retrovirus-related Pol polyprotein from transposon TNT 1-94 n=1 Tax=Vitis vinifera TaxID=29760 RepID=A0A438CPQ3_VITVI|nr:Retrovirus-related Pol polyprotein from transposon TNT 1-94 [Vitis vinifera]